MNNICISINTGRCGTTFLYNTLQLTYPEFEIYHESVSDRVANPRDHLWKFDEADFAEMRADPGIAEYLDWIAATASDRPLVDPGNTPTPLVPLIAATFPGRVRVLHLVREPMSLAASHTNVTTYAEWQEYPERFGGSRPGGLRELFRSPRPIESRSAHPEYASKWDEMTPFEKNLWRWSEINLFALEFHERFPDVPFLTVTSEDLYRNPSGSVQRIIEMYGLPPHTPVVAPPEARRATNLNCRHSCPVGEEWRKYEKYGHILDLARRLGVPVDPARLESRMRRFAAPSPLELFAYRLRFRMSPRYWWNKLQRAWCDAAADRSRRNAGPGPCGDPQLG